MNNSCLKQGYAGFEGLSGTPLPHIPLNTESPPPNLGCGQLHRKIDECSFTHH